LNDRRRLGVPVSRIVLHAGTALTDLAPDHPSLAGGWHGAEQDGRHLWRWTDGSARLPIPAGTRMIEIHLAGDAEYPLTEGVEPDVRAMRRHHVA
jgi:hypothetical protein